MEPLDHGERLVAGLGDRLPWSGHKKGGFAMQCDKNEYRGVLAGLEGVTGKKAVNSDAITVKN
jgi:hypothetical protein